MSACARPGGVYVPRQTHDCDAAVLVRRHLPGFLARLEEAGHALPEFVREELAEFAGCGDFERGFVQTMCRRCGDELRVPFSCNGRGFCPSCMGRRMAEGAALLVDHVLPAVGYRQWVLSFEGPLAVRLGYDEALLARVAEGLARAAMQDMRWSVKERHGLGSVEQLHAGVFTVVQRFRSDLGLYVHLHCLVTDGAFEELGDEVRFLPAATPTPERLVAVLAQVHKALGVTEDDLKAPWRSGAAHADMTPDKFLARLCALVPPPGFHQTRYYGVFANRHHLRPRIIPPSAVPAPGQQLPLGLADDASDGPGELATDSRPRRLGWANLLARVFAVDVTICRTCGGRMRVVAVVTDPDDIARILHGARAPPRPPRPHPPGQVLLFAC